MAIVKGETQDEYLWDAEYWEPRAGEKDKDGNPVGAKIKGGWRSRIEYLKMKK